MQAERSVNRYALVVAIFAAALMTAGIVTFLMTRSNYPNIELIFLFAFLYALVPGLIGGVPILGYMITHDEFRWWTALFGGSIAATLPGLMFLLLIANCQNNGTVLGMTTCTQGAWNQTAYELSGILLGGLAALGGAAGLTGFIFYRLIAGGRTKHTNVTSSS